MNMEENTYVGNLRPAGFSDDEEDDDDSDFSLMAPRPLVRYVAPVVTIQEKFQSIITQGNFLDFENILKNDLQDVVDYRFNNGWTPLMYTCLHGQHRMVDYLLERGADPNAHADSITPLQLVCSNASGRDELLRGTAAKLLMHGAILNLGDKHGMTPLMKAIQSGRDDLVEFMIENKANIEMRDRQGWTAIFWAVHCGRMYILEYLISLGARITEVDRSNRTVLDIAESHDHKNMVNLLEKYFTKRNIEETSCTDTDHKYWFQYYPGLENNKRELYKAELYNLLYGMNCDHLRSYIAKSGIDLKGFLLLDENDMIKMGIAMEFERQRIKKGLRAFHTRNWKLKAVSGLYAKLNDDYELFDCLENISTNFMQTYVLEASMIYAVRYFKKLQGQLKFEPPDLHTINNMKATIKQYSANIEKIKREIVNMHQTVDDIRRNSPELIEYTRQQARKKVRTTLHLTVVGVVSCGMGYIAYRSVKWCFSSLIKWPTRGL